MAEQPLKEETGMEPELTQGFIRRAIRYIAAGIRYVDTDTRMTRQGISPGKEIKSEGKSYSASSSNPMAIYRPNSGSTIDAGKAMSNYKDWAGAAIKAISDDLAHIEFRIFQIKPNGDHEEQFEHELLDLLDAVNDFQTGLEFKHILVAHLELTGNAYLLMNGVKSDADIPKSLNLLDPSRVRVKLDQTTFPYKISGYEFTLDNRTYSFKPYEIIHIRYPNPSNQYMGLGTVMMIADWIDNDNYASEFNRQYFMNGARIGGILETQMTGEASLIALKISFEEQHAGVNNAYKTLALPKGVVFKPSQESMKDMDFKNLSEINRDKILAGMRVSKTILGTAESDTNRATAETADYVFAKRTIEPKMKLIISFLNHFLVPRFSDDIYLQYADFVPEDKAFRVKEMQAMTGNAPVLSVNETRETYAGLGPIEGGDQVMSPTTMQPLGAPKKRTPSTGKMMEKSKLNKAVKHGKVVKTQFARNKKVRKEASRTLAESIAKIFAAKKTIADMTDDEFKDVYKDFTSRVDKYEKQVIEALQKVNAAQEKEVLENLKNFVKAGKTKGSRDLFDLNKWVSITTNALEPILTALYSDEGTEAGNLIGKPGINVFDNPENQAALDHAMDLMSRSYEGTILDTLRTELNNGLAEGDSLPMISDRIQGIYEWNNRYGAERVAKTETFRVANTSNRAVWKQSGVVKTIKWYTGEDDKVCPFCKTLDGTIISINDPFFNLGDTVTAEDGTEMEVKYDTINNPPLHPNCRCYIRPVDISIQHAHKEVDEVEDAIDEIEKA